MMKNKILLVGSGGSLIDSQLGSKIDNFEGLICRFNLFSVEGFETDVGSRTDVWCLNSKAYYNCYFEGVETLNLEKEICFEDLEDFEGEILIAGTRHLWGKYADSGYMQEAIDELNIAKVMNYESLKLGFKLVGSHKYSYDTERTHKMIPSSGFQAIIHYLSEGYEVYLVGFDSSNKKIQDKLSHYYSEHKYVSDNTIDINSSPLLSMKQHNYKKEEEIINMLEIINSVKRLD
jgi:hypothetical protein